jgi:enoyl-CoA hydratase
MSANTEVVLDFQGSRAVVTFRTEAGVNVLSPSVIKELGRVAAEIDRTADIRSVVFRAEGKAFLAGADIKAMQGFDRAAAHDMSVAGHSALDQIERLAPVTIAAIHATAAGGGLEVALACDFRIGARGARMGLPEALLGLIPGWGGTQRLPRLIGRSAAKRLMLSGELITAEEAHQMGLVDELVDSADQMGDAVDGFLARFDKAGPQAIGRLKRAMDQGNEQDNFAECFEHDECREGMAAFVEKRPARWGPAV